MKKSLWLLAAITPALLASCGSSSDSAYGDQFKDYEYLPVRLDRNSGWSMIGPDGELLFDDGFDKDVSISAVINGVFSVRENDKISVYSADKNPKVIGDLEDLKAAGALSDGVMPIVRPQERITLVDKNGKTVATLEPVGGKEIIQVEDMSHNGRMLFGTEDGKCGYIDTDGNVVIAPTFDNCGSFNEDGYATVYKQNNDDEATAYIIDKKGETVFKAKSGQNIVSMYGKRVMLSSDENRLSISKFDGEAVKLPAKYTSCANWNNDYIVVRSDDGWGVVKNNEEFEVVIKPRYDSRIVMLPDGKFLVKKDEDTIILDKNGERVFTFDDIDMEYINSKWNFLVRDGKEYYLADEEGKRIGKTDFTDISGAASVSYGSVSSDYFNIDAFVSTITEQVTADAISGYKIGSNTATYMTGENPEDYTYSYRPNSGKEFEGYRFKVTTSFVGVQHLGEWKWEDPYSYYNYNRIYTWTNTPVESASLNAVAYSSDLWKKIKPLLIKSLESKGFKVDEQSDDIISMTNSNIHLYINASDSYGSTEISMSMTDTGEYVVAEAAPVEAEAEAY